MILKLSSICYYSPLLSARILVNQFLSVTDAINLWAYACYFVQTFPSNVKTEQSPFGDTLLFPSNKESIELRFLSSVKCVSNSH